MMDSIRQNKIKAFDTAFGIYQSISTLANDDLTKFDIILNKPFKHCLTHLMYLKTKNEVYGNNNSQ
jgi:hypothetical protein